MPTTCTSILPGRESPIKTGTSQESTPAPCIPQGQGPGCLKREGILWLLSLHFRLQGPRCREGHLHKGLALRTTGWASPEGRDPLFLGVELGTGRPKRGRVRGAVGDADRRPELIGLCSPSLPPGSVGRGPPLPSLKEYCLCPWVLLCRGETSRTTSLWRISQTAHFPSGRGNKIQRWFAWWILTPD